MIKMNNSIFEPILKGTFIDTIQGKAYYYITEIEDKNERWNDNYYVTNGFYVTHSGKFHYVYKVR